MDYAKIDGAHLQILFFPTYSFFLQISYWLRFNLKRPISVQFLSDIYVGGTAKAIGDTETKIHSLHPSAYILVRKEDTQINLCRVTYTM